MLGLPLHRQIEHVQVGARARAPVQHHLALHADVQGVLDDALDRREAGAAGDEDDRLVAVFAQEERAERTFEAQDVALLHLAEHVVGERAVGHVAHVQLDVRVVLAAHCPSSSARRLPSRMMISRYWPARNCSRSLAGRDR